MSNQPPEIDRRKTSSVNIAAVVAVILGIAAVVVGLFWSYLLGGLMGIVTWAVAGGARGVARSRNGQGRVLAVTGAVLGVAAVVLMIIGSLV
jgi:hypothetical protein